ncbi:tetraspanin-18 [Iris pallida]|uniref:Tetraspanin-18 n=1 Tax=Iris pallida TaxID=29817 RepID=A0AAX6G9R1_IRIPA|nr:tetraspanin-18 [Iris pallida]KAJ6825127.1 tetraspanin-18 [Iris pallida]KAJ6842919.1 tetraspanin-18 [Iris pallida]
MRPSLCRSCVSSLLKLLVFLQTFVGVSVLVYSAWILNCLSRHGGLHFGGFGLDKLPAPWFVCALMGIGILVCLIAFTGHVAAEAINGCCLCFYAVLTTVLILVEAALVGYVVFNKHWEEDLPYDSTGELKNLRLFIEDNIDIFKWVGVTVTVIQALSLLLSVILRAMVSKRTLDYDSNDEFLVIRRPLLNHDGAPTYFSTGVDGHHPDFWSSQMRQKYGLNQNYLQSLTNRDVDTEGINQCAQSATVNDRRG